MPYALWSHDGPLAAMDQSLYVGNVIGGIDAVYSSSPLKLKGASKIYQQCHVTYEWYDRTIVY